ncbi:collagen-like protein [Bacillus velezensis]|uniref:collagen-like protein n=1 Tax=Bacillus velezensis TaxID=492670 RepID=UPI0025A0912A|nr:collagen-like protein [Bacillus velezensis]WJM67059.1 collagen-like protein [Bacillus velezensis]
MAEDYLYESNGVKTSSEKGKDGKAITPVYLKENSEENPLFVKGLQGEKGEPGPQGEPAVIEEGSIVHEMLAEKSVRSKNIGTGSVMPEHLNSEVTKALDELKQKMNKLESDLAALKGIEEEPTE